MRIFSKLVKSIRKRLWPTDREVAIKQYRKDGGDEAMRFDFDLGEDSLVIDFGGYEGAWAQQIFNRYGCRIEIFEPVKEFFDEIEKHFIGNSKVRAHQFGLGATSREERIALCADASSMLIRDDANVEVIQLIDVINWFEKEAIRYVDLVKMNIEGGEYELLERMIETGLIRYIGTLQVQFHDLSPESESRMIRIRECLSETHMPVFHYHFVWDCWKRKS